MAIITERTSQSILFSLDAAELCSIKSFCRPMRAKRYCCKSSNIRVPTLKSVGRIYNIMLKVTLCISTININLNQMNYRHYFHTVVDTSRFNKIIPIPISLDCFILIAHRQGRNGMRCRQCRSAIRLSCVNHWDLSDRNFFQGRLQTEFKTTQIQFPSWCDVFPFLFLIFFTVCRFPKAAGCAVDILQKQTRESWQVLMLCLLAHGPCLKWQRMYYIRK